MKHVWTEARLRRCVCLFVSLLAIRTYRTVVETKLNRGDERRCGIVPDVSRVDVFDGLIAVVLKYRVSAEPI